MSRSLALSCVQSTSLEREGPGLEAPRTAP